MQAFSVRQTIQRKKWAVLTGLVRSGGTVVPIFNPDQQLICTSVTGFLTSGKRQSMSYNNITICGLKYYYENFKTKISIREYWEDSMFFFEEKIVCLIDNNKRI